MKKQLLVLLLFATSIPAMTQEVIATTGDTASGGGISLSWTLGETVINTYQSDSLQLTQGFHQSYFVFSTIEEYNSTLISTKIYPNPAAGQTTLYVDKPGQGLKWTLLSADGKILGQYPVETTETTIDLSRLSGNIYFLSITGKNGYKQVFKLIKQ